MHHKQNCVKFGSQGAPASSHENIYQLFRRHDFHKCAQILFTIQNQSIFPISKKSFLTFILARKVSMLETAVWNTSEGRSYQTWG